MSGKPELCPPPCFRNYFKTFNRLGIHVIPMGDRPSSDSEGTRIFSGSIGFEHPFPDDKLTEKAVKAWRKCVPLPGDKPQKKSNVHVVDQRRFPSGLPRYLVKSGPLRSGLSFSRVPAPRGGLFPPPFVFAFPDPSVAASSPGSGLSSLLEIIVALSVLRDEPR